ncbi:TPA: fimbrial biogenesis outer membrane usher protein [Salmonella enterica]|nr:fimbrial biogenesis outer membrane usher protein [Salmonella enterica]
MKHDHLLSVPRFFSILSGICFLFCFSVTKAVSAENVEFNASFLSHTPGKNVIDVRRFNYGNPTPAGTYNTDVYLNGVWKGKVNILFIDTTKTGKITMLCLTPELVALLDLVPQIAPRGMSNHQCNSIAKEIPSLKSHFNLSALRLDLEVPQAMLIQRPRDYISPTQWQTGISAAFLNYNINNYQFHSSNANSNQTYLGLRTGFNIEGWSFRHRGSRNWSENNADGYSTIETYLQHDIAQLRAQFTLGDFTTSGELLDSVSLRGVRIASDDRMLPGSLRGYAPIVRGVADSNAKVSVRQNGNIIYETTVPAGPFTINDLYPSGYGGDLTVTVTEASGQSRTFLVPFSSVAQLIRPGYTRWQLSTGRYRYGHETLSDTVFQGTIQYGFTNDITLNGGLTGSPHYTATLGGLAFNTPVGAIASDITLSRATFSEAGGTRKGYSLHTSYSVNFPATSTNLTLATYRYSSKDFYNLRDAMRSNHIISDKNSIGNEWAFYRPKNQFQLSLNQVLGDNLGNLYLTGSTFQYWGRQGRRNEYQLGYSNLWHRLNYQIGFSQSRDNDNSRKDERIYLNLSVPLGDSLQTPLLATVLSHSKNIGDSIQTSISGAAGQNNEYSYGASFNRQERSTSGYSLNGSYRSPVANFAATAGSDSAHNRQMSLGVSGAVVAHPYGITLSNDLSDTFTIVHAKGAKGATINNAPGNRLDYWGNAIVPYVTPYEKNRISIDPTYLPPDTELSATEQEIIPRVNSATLVTFSTQTGNATLFYVKLSNGDIPPMAAEVFSEQGNSIGYIAQGGKLYTRGLPAQGKLNVIWGADVSERCSFHYQETRTTQQQDIPPILNVVCIQK